MRKPRNRAIPGPPALWGLVLAGGDSRRMGRDKGQLPYRGEPQARRALQLLNIVCARAFVSVRSDQAQLEPYALLPLIVDDGELRGPAAGLLAAWAQWPSAAWLTLATDLPLVGPALLGELIQQRAPEALATAFRHPDGTPEPLCTIWEPAARARLLGRARTGDHSLRRLLEDSAVELLDAREPD
ncbi:MAG TPA: NTP transferase domain-containing protein, partial [Gammaproteobacteria bacterium]|nr:NTP transferase domain-containing protein [Gammaproteobacteria bacterium]